MENHSQKIDDHHHHHRLYIEEEVDEERSHQKKVVVRRIHRVIPQLKKNNHLHSKNHVYDPIFITLGPYHHGRADLQRVQEFKPLCLEWLATTTHRSKSFYYQKIRDNIDEIRDTYAEASILEKYSDDELATMMLLDGCTIINYMATREDAAAAAALDWTSHLGLAAAPLMVRDMVKIENQVPFKVIKLLLISSQGEGRESEWDGLIHAFLRWMLLGSGSREQISVAGEYDGDDLPLHILEAIWRAIAGKFQAEGQDNQAATTVLGKTWDCARRTLAARKPRKKKQDRNPTRQQHGLFGSVTDLKAKGIRFAPSSHSLRAISFESSLFHGRLRLPIRYVSDQHQVVLANLIGYELSPASDSACTVVSYAAFMKALIESPQDVKELQENGILFNKYSNHEQVVESFKEIDVLGLEHSDVFDGVKEKIGRHCKSRPRAWMGNLVVAYLCSPWRVISLSAATALLVFTFLQAFYAVRGGRSAK